MHMRDAIADLRRHPRSMVMWPVTVETADRCRERQTMNVGPMGAKVLLDEPLPIGASVRLRFRPPHSPPLDVEAIVWRSDPDGSAFFFVGVEEDVSDGAGHESPLG